MDIINLIGVIVIGFFAGLIASVLTGQRNSSLVNIILGILGAAVGSFLFRLLGISLYNNLINSLIAAVVGALVIIFLVRAIFGRRRMRL